MGGGGCEWKEQYSAKPAQVVTFLDLSSPATYFIT